MIRHAAQTFKHLLLTVLLLIGGVCAVEVALRVQRATQSSAVRPETSDLVSATTAPSRATYLAVAPQLRFSRIEAESQRPFTLRTNSFGLRNPEVEVPRPSGVFRVLCLGDDTTFAGDLPESYTFCKLLGDAVQSQTSTQVEVLNAGCPGGCPTVSALLLRHRFLTLQPDVILIHIDPGDLADEDLLRRHVVRSSEGYPLSAMHPATAGRTNLASQLDDELLVVRTLRDEVSDLWSRGQAGESPGRVDLPVSGGAFSSIRLALESIQRLAAPQSIEVLVTTAAPPSAPSKRRPAPKASQLAWPPAELVALCDELKLPLIDATADIEDELGGEPRPRGAPAFGPDSQLIYSEVLAKAILGRFSEPQTPPQRISGRTEIR